eukprot:sb/3477229/
MVPDNQSRDLNSDAAANQNSLFRTRDWLSTNQGLVFPHCVTHLPTDKTVLQPIRTRYLGHVTGYQPIRDQYFLIPDTYLVHHTVATDLATCHPADKTVLQLPLEGSGQCR